MDERLETDTVVIKYLSNADAIAAVERALYDPTAVEIRYRP